MSPRRNISTIFSRRAVDADEHNLERFLKTLDQGFSRIVATDESTKLRITKYRRAMRLIYRFLARDNLEMFKYSHILSDWSRSGNQRGRHSLRKYGLKARRLHRNSSKIFQENESYSVAVMILSSDIRKLVCSRGRGDGSSR